ncbi:MAG: hypothetical protein CMJ54_05005 [Planctomycetaceae bacterium]|nr:hypothetical protein [Planctomycetaceae bacterium]
MRRPSGSIPPAEHEPATHQGPCRATPRISGEIRGGSHRCRLVRWTVDGLDVEDPPERRHEARERRERTRSQPFIDRSGTWIGPCGVASGVRSDGG